MITDPDTPIDHLLRMIATIPRNEMWKGLNVCIACGTLNDQSHSEACWRVDLHYAAETVRLEVQKKGRLL